MFFLLNIIQLNLSIKLGALLGNVEYSNVYFFIGHPIPFKYIRTVIFNKLDHSLLLLFILDCHHCLTILKVFYLLHEDRMALLAPTNQP